MHAMMKHNFLLRFFNLSKCKEFKLLSLDTRCFSLSRRHNSAISYASSLPASFYNEEQKGIQKSVSKLIETKINQHVDEWEAKEQAPTKELLKLLGSIDCLGINKPQEYGGLGLPYKYHAAFLEELGSINALGVFTALSVLTDVALPALSKFGSDELKKEFLVPSIKGGRVACIGVSEPCAGSDIAGTVTIAKRDEENKDDLIISGQKVWVSNGMQADWMCLLATTSDGEPHKSKSLICVPLDSQGVSRLGWQKLGLKSNDWGQIFFEDVRVPAKNIIGEEGMGFVYQMQQLQEIRLATVLGSLRPLDNTIAKTIDYTRERKAFGQSILSNQVVHFRLAELATEVECLRALTYQAVDKYTAGEDVAMLISMIKLKCGRLSREVADTCLQYWGAMGYSAESTMARCFRDFRQLSVSAGTDEIMLQIICKHMDIYPPNDCYRTASIK